MPEAHPNERNERAAAKPPGLEFARPYVVSWNLTYRCNLACEHCYLDAGGTPRVDTENFADRSELGTEDCFRVIEEIAAFAPECLTILTGGEPLLRRDILEIIRRAAERELWVVVGTNGVRITENLAGRLAEAGARGLSLSLDALDPDRHDRFRNVRGAWRNTVEGAEILNRTGLPFIVQTTAGSHNLGELDAIADFAHDRLAAKVWNLYFLVPTGRGQFVSDITPAQYDEVLASLYRIQRKYNGRMLVNAKCAPHYIKTMLENGLPPARTYSGGAGGCPAGTHYMGIRPNGDVTPCPYLPVFAGTLRTSSLADLWTSSELFVGIRRRTSLGGRCGECEMNGHCGGCRARAYGMTGDLMAEDPLCTHTPGKFVGSPLLLAHRSLGEGGTLGGSDGVGPPPVIEYGGETQATIAWDDAAAERMKKIPAFVRGMVTKAVEESCRRNGIDRVTIEELERIRADADAEDVRLTGTCSIAAGRTMVWPFNKRTTWKEHFDQGLAAGGAGDIEGALPHFREAVRLAPLEPYPHYELGYTLSLLGQFEPALRELRRTNELAEGFFVVQTEIYICEAVLAGLLDYECAAALRQLQRLTDSGQARSHDAVSLSRELIRRAPTCALGHYYLGKALFVEDSKASEDALRHCLTLSPDDTTAIDALTHIGSHKRATGDVEGARAIWSDVVAKYKNNPHVKPTEVFFLEGSA